MGEVELYVPLRNSFFSSKDLKPGELRTLALLLSQREDYIFYENITAKQLNVSLRTMERRFKRLLELGYIKKVFKVNYNQYKKNFNWVLTNDSKIYKVSSKNQKYYTRFKKSFILDNNINDFDWLVLSVMLCNSKDYKNYPSTIRNNLNISSDKRSKLTKSIERLESMKLVFKNYDTNGKLFYALNDEVWNFIIKIDRSQYETEEQKQERKTQENLVVIHHIDYEKQKKYMDMSLIYKEE